MSSQSPAESSDRAAVGQRSCATCRRRKVRCDKQLPCSPCARGGHDCSYPPKQPRAPRVRKATISDVATRISNLEKTLITGLPEHGRVAFKTPPKRAEGGLAPAAPASATGMNPLPGAASPPGEILLGKGSSSQYFNEVLVSRVLGHESRVRSVLAIPAADAAPRPPIPSPFNPMGLLSSPVLSLPLSSFHPSKTTAGHLWRVYVDKVDIFFKVLHVPTTEILVYTVINDPDAASPESLSLCFAIYYAAAVALEDAPDCLQLLGEDWPSALQRYKTGMEQAFARADLLENPTLAMLQGLSSYIYSLRAHNTSRAVWILNGLAIRIAQSIGLHRDGENLGLSPFESEMRRRLWWFFVMRDSRAAEDLGLHAYPVSSTPLHGSAELPLNVEDSDLYPEMKELPPPRKGWTKMTNTLANIDITQTCADLLQMSWTSPSAAPPSFEVRDGIISKLVNRVDEMLHGCIPVIPVHRLTLLSCRFLTRKIDFVSRQQWVAQHHPDRQELLANDETLNEAVDLLKKCEAILDDDLLWPYFWLIKSHPQYHLMLFILWSVCYRPRGACVQRALQVVQSHVRMTEMATMDNLRGPKWRIFEALQAKAATLIPQPPANQQTQQTQQNQQNQHGGSPGTGPHLTNMPPLGAVGPGAEDQAGGNHNTGGGFMLGCAARELADMDDATMFDEMQYVPDWSTLLQSVMQEDGNFSLLV
ncbi:uncharacterized protein UV8b_07213 [Ustilaginoidea virens]|uniref:Zn(2)-C6 fungal-type domain-containing protein n=1 Tax=Ustilaginoidea virens TaxID=1159556 RepID=A0A8E5MKS2_USTVR|nr:uncharacterized protein UV8b_07213 [Ustilaginoidea virens]QUC22972.1 hypothetical protein UV8b_07213 [Ustilaginoidea virens]